MTPETKKRLAYGAVIVVGGGVAIFIWHKYGSGSAGSQASTDAAAEAAQQAQASSEETQLAELSELGSSGSSLESPNIGNETPVEDFGTELSQVLEAVGLEPVPTPVSGSGATSSTPPTTATGSTGTTPNPVTTPVPKVTVPIPISVGGPVEAKGGPIYYTGSNPEPVINSELVTP